MKEKMAEQQNCTSCKKKAIETTVTIDEHNEVWAKPSVIRSENYLHNIKASNGSGWEVQI